MAMQSAEQPAHARMSARWFPVVLLLSFVVMIPWPTAGIALTQSFFDNAWEVYFMFGGLTAIPVAILSVPFGGFSNEAFGRILLVVWGLVVVVPPALVFATRPTRTLIVIALTSQLIFSLIQAALGALMVIGKDV